MNIKRDIFRVFLSKIINVGIGLIIGFIVPIYLSVEDYGNLSMFTFYIGYVGMLHMGYVDGVYIKYGGENYCNIDNNDIKKRHNVLLIIEVIVTIILILYSLFFKSEIIFLIAVTIIPINITALYQYLFQATGEFKKFIFYSNLLNILILTSNIFIIYILKVNNYKIFIYSNIIIYYLIFMLLEINYNKRTKNDIEYDKIEEIEIFKVGFLILLANVINILIYSLDRWFIKIFFDSKSFAYYSFAFSLISVINIFMNSISLTMYNYMIKNNSDKTNNIIKNCIIIISTISTISYFIFYIIIHKFISNYILALDIVSIIFLSIPYCVIINVIFINIYKANKMQKQYLKSIFKALIVGFILNIIAIILYKDMKSIAFATTISYIIWFYISKKDLKEKISINKFDSIFLLLIMVSFYICTNVYSIYIGAIIYIIIVFISIYLFYGKFLKEFILKKY